MSFFDSAFGEKRLQNSEDAHGNKGKQQEEQGKAQVPLQRDKVLLQKHFKVNPIAHSQTINILLIFNTIN